MLVSAFFVHHARETAGAARTRSSLRPLTSRAKVSNKNFGRIAPREQERMSHNVIARSVATRQSSHPFCREMDCFAPLAMTGRSRSVLDTPPTRGMTVVMTSAWRDRRPTINPVVTTFIYPSPTISRAPRAYGWRVSCHVAFQCPGLGGAVGGCRRVCARRVLFRVTPLHRSGGDNGPD